MSKIAKEELKGWRLDAEVDRDRDRANDRILRLLSEREEMESRYGRLREAAKVLDEKLHWVMDEKAWAYTATREARKNLQEAIKGVEE